jgi:adenosylcobinamide-GDP ribazoletransferase
VRFVAAFRFLTVIPLPLKRAAGPEEIGGSVVYFPVVGLIIGLLLAGAYWILDRLLPTPLANGLIIAGMVLINGALHMDGFIDTCDGLAGNKPAQERWQVMRDSRVGAFGVVGAVLLLLVKFAALSGIPYRLVFAGLILMPVVSRWLMVYAVTAYPYARPDGLGTLFKGGANWERFTLATAFALLVAAILLWWLAIPHFFLAALAIMGGAWLAILGWTQYLTRKFAGLTGDSYGAVSELAEVAVLLAMALLVHNRWLWMR